MSQYTMTQYTMTQFTVGVSMVLSLGALAVSATAAERFKVHVESTADGTRQPSYVIVPTSRGQIAQNSPLPLLVSLHSWSADLEQRNEPLEQLAAARGWIYLFPNFRGPNDNPAACGSELAQQDILDAVEWTKQHFPVDEKRIYLTGTSGGGHMTLLMAGRHPRIWAAASAWVGISDLAAWHRRHAGENYGNMMEAVCGGPPGRNASTDEQYELRSPLSFLQHAGRVPVDIAAGIHDGHDGSVPIRHSLEAFNVIATSVGGQPISETEIEQLSRLNGRLESPFPQDREHDDSFGREIHLRRTAGQSRVTIFEGGHEGIASATVAWLARHVKTD